MAQNDEQTAMVTQTSKAVAKFKAVADDIALLSGDTVVGNDAMLLASMFFSGYFKDIDSLSKAVVRAAFGKRIGVDIATAVTSLYIIDGKPALEAQAIRNTCVSAGYDIITKKLDDSECILEWHFKGEKLGESKFTKIDAQRMGFIDPTCDWPDKHNTRTLKKYDRYKKQWVDKQGCECKDNWIKVPQDMLLARATTKGARAYGNRALKEEVYDVEELRDSNIKPDTTAIDIAKITIEDAKTIKDLQELTSKLQPSELEELLPLISARTQEILEADKGDKKDAKTTANNS